MTHPSRPNLNILLLCLLAFFFGVGVRLIEFPRWLPATHQVDGEWLLPTHDAYFWVAGAGGDNVYAEPHPMALLLKFLAGTLGAPPANIAFWAAILLAALVTIPTVLWGNLLSTPYLAGITACLGALAPAFFNRTRLGFYDSDWATLFFPLLMSWLLASWLQPRLHIPEGAEKNMGNSRTMLGLAVLISAIALPWHNVNGLFLIAMLAIAGLLVALLGLPGTRSKSYLSLLALALVAGFGWVGAGLGLLLVLSLDRLPARLLHPDRERLTGFLLAFLLLAFTAIQFWEYLALAIPAYAGRLFGIGSSPEPVFALAYPGLASSVRETQQTNLSMTLAGMAFHPLLGVAGLVGFLALLRKRPAAALLLPLLVLGLGSSRLGIRFTMFGTPVLMLGLLASLEWAKAQMDQRLGTGTRTKVGAAVMILLILGAFSFQATRRLQVETVVDRSHARTLKDLGSLASEDDLLWTWWDYGYASQHFSGMETFADGRRNTGEYLFSLGTVLGSESLDRSAGFMHFSAQKLFTPWDTWSTWNHAQWQAFQAGMEGIDAPGISLPVQQYLIVQWQGITALPWIQFFGSWDFDTHEGQRSQVAIISRPLDLDLESGLFRFDEDQIVMAASVDRLGGPGTQHYAYPANASGPHVLLNNATGEVMLLDDRAYSSTFIQLLILPADQTLDDFELVLDDQPFARVFRLR